MYKITKGNDFSLRIPITDGSGSAYDITDCTDVSVALKSAYKTYLLTYEVTDGNTIVARVEGDTLTCGVYAVEVKGKTDGNDWRIYLCQQICIVECSEDADTDFGEGSSVITVGDVTVLSATASIEFGVARNRLSVTI